MNSALFRYNTPQGSWAHCEMRWIPSPRDSASRRWKATQMLCGSPRPQKCIRCGGDVPRIWNMPCARCHENHYRCPHCRATWCRTTILNPHDPELRSAAPGCPYCPDTIRIAIRGAQQGLEKIMSPIVDDFPCITCRRQHTSCRSCSRLICYGGHEDTEWIVKIFFPYECIDEVKRMPGIKNAAGPIAVHTTDRHFPQCAAGSNSLMASADAHEAAFEFFRDWDLPRPDHIFVNESGEPCTPFMPELLQLEYPSFRYPIVPHPKVAALAAESVLATMAMREMIATLGTELKDTMPAILEYMEEHTAILRWAGAVGDVLDCIKTSLNHGDLVRISPDKMYEAASNALSLTMMQSNRMFNPVLAVVLRSLLDALLSDPSGMIPVYVANYIRTVCNYGLMMTTENDANAYCTVVGPAPGNRRKYITCSFIDCWRSIREFRKPVMMLLTTSPATAAPNDFKIPNEFYVKLDKLEVAAHWIVAPLAPDAEIVPITAFKKLKKLSLTVRHSVPFCHGLHEWFARGRPFARFYLDDPAPDYSDTFWNLLDMTGGDGASITSYYDHVEDDNA